jgi:hypothetical protein
MNETFDDLDTLTKKGGGFFMRQNRKGIENVSQWKQLSFHDFLSMEKSSNHMELAEEFGLDLFQVNQLKKKIKRENY